MTYDLARPHAVASMGSLQPAYDNNGNMSAVLSSGNYQETFAFNVENRLVATGQWVSPYFGVNYLYDGAGNLVRQRSQIWINPTATDTKETTVDGIYHETSYWCGAAASVTKEYSAFGRIIAVRNGYGLNYQLTDQVGSAAGSIGPTGTVSATVKFYPFGAGRSGQIVNNVGYTGQKYQPWSTIGAYYYRARFYSPLLAHFMSADSSTADGLDRYAYVRGNPVRYNDPTGYGCVLPFGPDCEDLAAPIVEVINTAVDIVGAAAHAAVSLANDYAAAAANGGYDAARSVATAMQQVAESISGEARLAWRETYTLRSDLVQAVESAAMKLASTTDGVAHQISVGNMAAVGMSGLAYGVRVVTGCGGAVCDELRRSGADAITIGHTIFTWKTTAEILRDGVYSARFRDWMSVLRHELTHVGQYEDMGDAFFAIYFGSGMFTYIQNGFNGGGWGFDRWQWATFTSQLLERQAYDQGGKSAKRPG
jgi:RHS repeat-associated protein